MVRPERHCQEDHVKARPALGSEVCYDRGTSHTLMNSTMPKKEYRWRIYHIKGTPAQFLGTASATDEQAAIKRAISELEIKDPQTQKRLITLRQG
jgi:hypothetical protein